MMVLLSKYLSGGAIQLFNFWLLTHLNEEPAHCGMASKLTQLFFLSKWLIHRWYALVF